MDAPTRALAEFEALAQEVAKLQKACLLHAKNHEAACRELQTEREKTRELALALKEAEATIEHMEKDMQWCRG